MCKLYIMFQLRVIINYLFQFYVVFGFFFVNFYMFFMLFIYENLQNVVIKSFFFGGFNIVVQKIF